jgi:hypothetical protein
MSISMISDCSCFSTFAVSDLAREWICWSNVAKSSWRLLSSPAFAFLVEIRRAMSSSDNGW